MLGLSERDILGSMGSPEGNPAAAKGFRGVQDVIGSLAGIPLGQLSEEVGGFPELLRGEGVAEILESEHTRYPSCPKSQSRRSVPANRSLANAGRGGTGSRPSRNPDVAAGVYDFLNTPLPTLGFPEAPKSPFPTPRVPRLAPGLMPGAMFGNAITTGRFFTGDRW